MDKKLYKEQLSTLRTQVLAAQLNQRRSGEALVLLISGMDGAGKGDLLNFLGENLDLRNARICTFWNEEDGEGNRPYPWRFWRQLPKRGEMAIFFGAWYSRPMQEAVAGVWSGEMLQQELSRLRFFEEMLARDGIRILKFWLHLEKDEQKKRHARLRGKGGSKAGERAMWHYRHYDTIARVAQTVIAATHAVATPWHSMDAGDRRACRLRVLGTLVQTLNSALPRPLPPMVSAVSTDAPLAAVDLTRRLEHKAYKEALRHWQGELHRLSWQAWQERIPSMFAFEGWDAAGKGGAIRRLAQAVDPRLLRIVSVAAPDAVELRHHYLWRFWRDVPRFGTMKVFDRTWYGRVLVERVEGFAQPEEWERAYAEIKAFEEALVDNGVVLAKFWLHISPEEQLRRFHERQQVPWKQHKITDEDWRNREKWPQYAQAVNEMLLRTDSKQAPWHIIAAEDKLLARIEILRHCCQALSERLADKRG